MDLTAKYILCWLESFSLSVDIWVTTQTPAYGMLSHFPVLFRDRCVVASIMKFKSVYSPKSPTFLVLWFAPRSLSSRCFPFLGSKMSTSSCTLFRLSPLIWLQFCNHRDLSCYLHLITCQVYHQTMVNEVLTHIT
jgi:hypothetical protein